MHTGNCTCFPTFAGVTCDKCKTGQYGNLCDQQCSVGCKSNVCERKSGNCKDGCIVDTIIGDKCDVCLTGWYGQNCNMSCSAGCKNQKCEKSNGECSYGCLDNFFGGQFNQCMHEVDEQCKVDCACCIERKCGGGKWFPNQCTLGCIDGYRGARCYIRCTHNCTKCPDREDTCTACYDGYYPGSARDCTSKCLPGCKTCTTGTTCTSCKEGYYNADGQSDCNCPVYCNCNNGQCVSCKDRYYDTSNLCYSLCPGNCVTCSSNNDCGSCKDGYYKGYQNDNINFPLLNDCTYKCRDNCLRCSSYDRCSLCKTGFYGPNCEKNCSTGCLSNSCDMQTGNCTCFPTFAGVRCDNCKTGKYGNMCNQECSAGCKGGVCEKESGDCTYGCTVVTIVGVKCENCSTGWYGQYCNISCSLGCKMEQCERSNGECSYGCLDNFEGRQCNQYMPDSSSTEQSFNTAGVILGTGFAVSLVLVVTLILWKCRKRANGNSTTRGPRNENSGIELECGSSANAGNVRNHGFVQESNSDVVLGSDYDNQNLGRVQVSEHECRQKNLVSLM
ncbi:multiple epidermal growth factor-like domains protein 10 [Ruditapes philippinarum]|uniref:multiple epidermal growth factor-like domains protein 10 n=1 Tax=Ruditapes philippinarum TaxID=129788 RepID=UPI00295B9327|nr:multiple epidermal growth factor-like domains protein 10 [Ruditapes philippinarum]